MLHRWMSDFSLTIEDLVADGDKVWTRNRARGVDTGSVMGNPPTGTDDRASTSSTSGASRMAGFRRSTGASPTCWA